MRLCSILAARPCKKRKDGAPGNEAISRMSRALEMFIIEGIFTTIPLHKRILADPDFRAGRFDTTFIERFLAKGKEK